MAMNFEPLAEGRRREVLEEWLLALDSLFKGLEAWGKSLQFTVERTTKQIEEAQLGIYEAPVIEFRKGETRLVAEPIARMVIGGPGRVDLYAYPSLAKLMLIRTEEGPSKRVWIALADSGVRFGPLKEKEDFERLVGSLS